MYEAPCKVSLRNSFPGKLLLQGLLSPAHSPCNGHWHCSSSTEKSYELLLQNAHQNSPIYHQSSAILCSKTFFLCFSPPFPSTPLGLFFCESNFVNHLVGCKHWILNTSPLTTPEIIHLYRSPTVLPCFPNQPSLKEFQPGGKLFIILNMRIICIF